MNSSIKQGASTIVVASMIVGCGSPASPAPGSPSPSASTAVVVSSTPTAPAESATASIPARPSTAAPGSSAFRPIRASARELSDQAPRLVPGQGGSLYVLISVREGPAVLLLLDGSGRPRPGWPISIKDSTSCGVPFPVADGSVRIVCDARDVPESESGEMDQRAFAFDADGRLMDGWPVLVGPCSVGMGTELRVAHEHFDDRAVTILSVAGDGTVRQSPPLGLSGVCCAGQWNVGPDGVAYGVGEPPENGGPRTVTGLEFSGAETEWSIDVEGVGSAPAFGPAGEVLLTFASDLKPRTRVTVLSHADRAVTSGAIPLTSAVRSDSTGECTVGVPDAPIVSQDGTIFIRSELRPSIFALDASLAVRAGWPFKPATPLATATPGLESEHEAGYCPLSVEPAAGPDGTLVLSLEARNPTVGGSLVAVGKDGQVRPGWPVELKRNGSEFWAVTVGSDGTTYALAVEPEAGGKSSESILAISPDSTVRYSTTIVDP